MTLGYNVTLRDIEQRFVDSGFNTIKKNLEKQVKKGKKTQDQADALCANVGETRTPC